jgi:polysaccharide chain length determinant protein (PEP-CTERM system associated)
MNELLIELRQVAFGAWRFRWVGVIAAWILALAGWAMVYSLPDIYVSRTRVYVDSESILRPLLTGIAVQRDVDAQVKLMTTVLLSRPNLEKVIRSTDLGLRSTDEKSMEKLVLQLQDTIEVNTTGKNVFEISFEDNDKRTSYKVVQTLLDTFIEDTLGMKRTDSGVAQRFLRDQLREYEQRLNDSEQRLADFKQKNLGLMPEQGSDYFSQLQSRSNALNDLRTQYAQLAERRAELRRQVAGESATLGVFAPPAVQAIDDQLNKLKAQRAALLVQYTERHPDVVGISETIDRLEAERKVAMANGKTMPAGQIIVGEGSSARVIDVNPVYQSVKIALSQTDAELAALRGRINAEQARISQLRGRAEIIPEVEAELSRLTRDYDVNNKQYQELLQRLESARISENADESAENVKFRIIDPPVLPLQPDGPPRRLFFFAVMLLAIMGGVGITVGLHLLKPVIMTREALHSAIGLPVMATMSELKPKVVQQWYEKEVPQVALALGVLVMGSLLNAVLVQYIRMLVKGVFA